MCDIVTYDCDTEDAVISSLSEKRTQLQTLTQLAKKPAVDIDFRDLTYVVRSLKGGKKTVLDSVSGCFRAGEMTAILGPSGAGKSSLLNILAGYVSSGIKGEIRINGLPRKKKAFHKLSHYIMQDDLLQPRLTVNEAMNFAADLKLGSSLSREQKSSVVEEILSVFWLQNCRNTFTESLSGGERRRLSVALEVVNNPAVLFLDEPTTGLDVSAARKCLEVLKVLADNGRTIICTIHQQSASDFYMFNNVYLMAKGVCSYHGTPQQLVPFLSSVGLECPKTYNPADYVMDVLTGEYGEHFQILSDVIKNGKRFERDAHSSAVLSDNGSCQFLGSPQSELASMEFPTSGLKQFSVILHRKWLQMYRNKTGLWIQLFYHVVIAMALSSIYYKVGNDGTAPFTNAKFNLCTITSLIYTHAMTHVLTLPSEVLLLKREYFNRWYGLKAYYMAFTFSTLPNLVFFTIFLLVPIYYFTDQPLELSRFLKYISILILTAAVSEGYGLMIGSAFNELGGAIAAPSTIFPLLMIAMHGMGYGSKINPVWNFIMSLDYVRYGFVGLSLILYTFGRPYFYCPTEDVYCHYQNPKKLLIDLGMEGSSIEVQVIGLIVFLFFYRIVAYFVLRYRLTFGLSHQILDITSKVLHYRRRTEQ